MRVSKTEDGRYRRKIVGRRIKDLPKGDVLVRVHYSSLNYKDALSASGNTGVTRNYPHTPGIDAAGVIVESQNGAFKAGDPVIVTSYDLGMNTPGGFGQYIRVPSDWVVPLPDGLSLRQAMCYGTAGFTAALSILQLMGHGVDPGQGEILVSGATGGGGSIAVSILARQGYKVAAVNGLKDRSGYLKSLGAHRIVSIEEASSSPDRSLLPGKWAGGIDAVGGDILATTIKSVKANGIVTTCGNAASPKLPITVYPFILRGVALVGIDSQNCPMPLRLQAWHMLGSKWQLPNLADMVKEVPLDELNRCINKMLDRSSAQGRVLVNMQQI